MQKIEIQSLTFPGDKSIAHRLVLYSLLTSKKLIVNNLPNSKDVKTSLNIVKKLGVEIDYKTQNNIQTTILKGLKKKSFKNEIILDCENSGTTARLLCGILCNLCGKFKLIGDNSLSKRPMQRVVKPLADLIGVKIQCTDGHLPIILETNSKTKPVDFYNETGSAQVKSAILFAGLANKGTTKITEKVPSRDHTERLLKYINNQNGNKLYFSIPGDISSAAYFAVLAAITKNKILFKNILLNPLRTGFLQVLKRMGTIIKEETIEDKWEPIGNLLIEGKDLHATDISEDEIPSLIDELPILAIAMSYATGTSHVSGASELRVKESDRISGLISQLKKAGVICEEKPDGFEITGGNQISDAELDSFNDHRLAMSFAILQHCSKVELNIKGKESANISFPEFYDYLKCIC